MKLVKVGKIQVPRKIFSAGGTIDVEFMRAQMLLKHNGELGKADPQQPSVSTIFTTARHS